MRIRSSGVLRPGGSRRALGLALGLIVAGCSSSKGTVAPFVVAATPDTQVLDTTPWPSDLFRDDAGHVQLAALPTATVDLTPALLDDLHTQQDGFGVSSGVYFPMPGTVDASTIDGHVHLYSLACGSDAPAELAIDTHLRAHDTPERLYARPQMGVTLREACTYGYVVTRGVRNGSGELRAADDLNSLLSTQAPSDARLARGYATYAPLRAAIASGLVAQGDIVDATVFTTHTVTKRYRALRAALSTIAAPAFRITYVFAKTKTADDDGSLDDLFGVPTVDQTGNDNPGGLSHDHVAFVVQGTYDSIDLLGGTDGTTGTATQIANISFGSDDVATSVGTAKIPFTLVVPDVASFVSLPVTIMQHGLGAERSGAMPVAMAMAAKGVATLAFDLPFHGGRNPGATDKTFRYTKASGSDGFAEAASDPSVLFFAVPGNAAKSIPGLLPRAVRSAFFQAVVDQMQALRILRGGSDLTPIGDREPRLAGLSFADLPATYVGESFGAMIGSITTALEPTLQGSVLVVGGGGLISPLLLNSAQFGPIFGSLLDSGLGVNTNSADDPAYTNFAYDLASYLLEEGDAQAFAPYAVAAQTWATGDPDHACHILGLTAWRDELVPNQANETLYHSMGLQPLTLSDGVAPDLTYWPGGTATTGPVSANGADGRTVVFIQFHDATHQMITDRFGVRKFDLSMPPPYASLNPPQMLDNPIDRTEQLAVDFVLAVQAGQVPTVQ